MSAVIPTPPADDALLAFLRRELPGCEFRVDNGFDYLVKAQVRSPRIGVTGNIDDMVALDERALAAMATELVRGLRAKAIEVFGLAAELTTAKDEARQAGRDDVVTELVNALNERRDENGQLPDHLVPASDWLRWATDKLPRVNVTPATDARDLERVADRARRL